VLTSRVVLMPTDTTPGSGVPQRFFPCKLILLALLAPTALRPPSLWAPVLVACGASIMTYCEPTRPSDSDPDSPSTCVAQPYDSQSRDEEPSVSTSLTPHLPLTEAINPVHRAFFPRLLPEHLEGHLRLPGALASRMGRLPCTSVGKTLCVATMQKVEKFEVNHKRGAARRGLPAQFRMSAKVLAGVTHGVRLGKPEAETKLARPSSLRHPRPSRAHLRKGTAARSASIAADHQLRPRRLRIRRPRSKSSHSRCPPYHGTGTKCWMPCRYPGKKVSMVPLQLRRS